jgi:hypothetical protein
MPPGNSTSSNVSSSLSDPANASRRPFCFGLLQARTCILPTWRGLLVGGLLALICLILVGRNLYGFLAVSDPVPGGVLVVEGWVPSVAAREAVAEFRRHSYLAIYVTGLPFEEGNPYIGFHNYAEFTAAKLVGMGAPPASIHVVSTGPVERNRTYSMATALKHRLEADGISTAKINVVSFGPHARRSRLLYEKVFGPQTKVGILSIVDPEFDPDHWWKTSAGVRGVIGEGLAYLYARLLFHPIDD